MTVFVFSVVCLIAFSSLVMGAAPTPEQLKVFAERQRIHIQQCKHEAAEAKKQLDDAEEIEVKTAGRKRADVQEAKKSRQASIDRAKQLLSDSQAKLARLQGGELPEPDPLFVYGAPGAFKAVKVGSIGVVAGQRVRILQVLNDTEMLVTVGGAFPGQASVGAPEATVLLRMPTEGLVDDSPLELAANRVFFVSGTYKYETIAGAAKTILSLEEIDMAAVRAHLKTLQGTWK